MFIIQKPKTNAKGELLTFNAKQMEYCFNGDLKSAKAQARTYLDYYIKHSSKFNSLIGEFILLLTESREIVQVYHYYEGYIYELKGIYDYDSLDKFLKEIKRYNAQEKAFNKKLESMGV